MPEGVKRTIQLLGLRAGVPHEYDGQYVVSYNPEAHLPDGSYDGGELICTPDQERAGLFDIDQAMALWQSGPTCECHWSRADGERNRPLSAFDCAVEAKGESVMRTEILTPQDFEEIIRNAEGRNLKEQMGVQSNKKSGVLTDLELHVLEVKGQFAVSRFLGVPMDWSICRGGNKNAHFTVNGITMRVQMPTYDPPVLKLDRAQDFRTDLMVVCYAPEPNVIVIYGCVSRERFLREHMMKEFIPGTGKRLVMMSWYLTPIEDYQEEALPQKKEPGVEPGDGSQLKKDVG